MHDQPFLNDNQRLAHLQNTITGSAKSEIQFLGEDGGNYAYGEVADPGKIVGVSPPLQGQRCLASLPQTQK